MTLTFDLDQMFNKMLSYRREIALQGALLAKSGRLELGDNT